MSIFAQSRIITDAALERSRAASQLITMLGPLLDPTLPKPTTVQAARVQRAALKLVDTAIEESGADATRYVGYGIAALYIGVSPKDFDAACEAGEGPPCVIVEGKAVFSTRALDAWLDSLSKGGAA